MPLLCLLGCLTLSHFADSRASKSSDAVASNSVEIEKAVAGLPHRQFSRPSPRISRDAAQTSQETALADPKSPVSSEDLDENREWARTHPSEALAWVLSSGEGPQHDTVIEMVCALMAETNAAQAVALAEQAGTNCANLLENMALQWAEQDQAAASAWALNQAKDEQRDRLLSRIAFVESKNNPAGAARLVVEEMLPGDSQNEAVISIMHQWALRDPNAAMAWAQAFPGGSLRERAIQEVQNITMADELRARAAQELEHGINPSADTQSSL